MRPLDGAVQRRPPAAALDTKSQSWELAAVVLTSE